MRKNLYRIVFIVYIMFNYYNLPHGLTWTMLFSPLLILTFKNTWLRLKSLVLFSFVTLPFFLIHNFLGYVEIKYYLISYLYALLSFLSAYYFYMLFNYRFKYIPNIIKDIVVLNFIFFIFAIFFKNTRTFSRMWIESNYFSIFHVQRFKFLTYEPSIYALVMAPFFLFIFFEFIDKTNFKNSLFLLAVAIPLYFTYSTGVLVAISLSLVIVFIMYNYKFFLSRRFILTMILIGASLGVLSKSIVFVRTKKMLEEGDPSGKIRTKYAYLYAWKIAKLSNPIFGPGFGQLKLKGSNIIPWAMGDIKSARVANSVASTLGTLGIMGVVLRFLIEIFLFFKTKCYSDLFRMSLFIFLFLYQFTGSFMTNSVELTGWAIAFSRNYSFYPIYNKNKEL